MEILIVDDDSVDREHITRYLCANNDNAFEIDIAESVDDGLKRFYEKKYDLILLDYKMPQRDGIEMLIELNNEPKEASTAIVMMSNAEEEEIALDCLRTGAQDFIVKNDITDARLRRVILNARTRFELELQLHNSYKKLREMAELDSLTGLANRYVFDEALKVTIANNQRGNNKVALLLLDIDNFKYINDAYGHDVGDILLQRIVKRVETGMRSNELFARLGGDEFGIILYNIETDLQASTVARRILNILEVPYEIDKMVMNSSASIGIAIHPDNAMSAKEIYKFADIALYRSKKLGKNQVCFFEDEMQRLFSMRYTIENELRKGMLEKQFTLFYQPIVNLINQEIIGFEALIRWTFNGEQRSPDDFIPIAEESRIILKLGRWIIEEAISQIAEWNKAVDTPFKIGINISVVQLTDLTLPKFIKELLETYNVAPDTVVFELTETAFLEYTDEKMEVINGIHNMGCSISLDDFGTGFSSVSHLRNFPISSVKIDKSLMPSKNETEKEISLLRGLVSMIKHLGLVTVGEGLETKRHVEICSELEVDRAQGYFFEKPVSKKVIQKKIIGSEMILPQKQDDQVIAEWEA